MDDLTGGDLYLGLAESYQIRYLAAAIKELKKLLEPALPYHQRRYRTGDGKA